MPGKYDKKLQIVFANNFAKTHANPVKFGAWLNSIITYTIIIKQAYVFEVFEDIQAHR